MKKLASLVLVALIGLLASIGLAASASAYPDAQQNLTVDRQVLYGGESFTAFATSDVTCDWTLEWGGDSRTRTSENFTTTYQAPAVTDVTKVPLNGTCAYDAAAEPRVSAKAAGTTAFQKTIVITVLPESSEVIPPSDDDLPNTGGPNVWILIAGLASVVVGAVVARTAKRRGAQA